MKTTKLPLTILSILMIFLFSCQNKQQDSMNKENNQNFIVLVKYKTQPSKSEEAIEGLKKLIVEVKKEPHFVKIIMHVDPMKNGMMKTIIMVITWVQATYKILCKTPEPFWLVLQKFHNGKSSKSFNLNKALTR